MKNIKLYDNIKNLFNTILKKDNSLIGSNQERVIDSTHGFVLIKDDAGTYLKNFLSEEQMNLRLENINNLGYMSPELGLTLKSMIDNQNHDTYIKSVHSKDIDSIMTEGIRCLGNSSSLSTVNPNTIKDISLQHTITKVDDLTMLVELVKKHNGFSQGFNRIDGSMILQIPKDTSKEEMFYYNENTSTYNIKPEYITGFIPVDENHVVKDLIIPTKENNIKK